MRKRSTLAAVVMLAAGAFLGWLAASAQLATVSEAEDKALAVNAQPNGAPDLDRTILPIPAPTRPTFTELDARKVTPPPRFEVKAPQGAPNILIVLLDDY